MELRPGEEVGVGLGASRDLRTHPWPQALLSVGPVEPMDTNAPNALCQTVNYTALSASLKAVTQVLDARNSQEELEFWGCQGSLCAPQLDSMSLPTWPRLPTTQEEGPRLRGPRVSMRVGPD